MSRAGVQKGKSFERNVARVLRKLDPRARRCLQYQRQHGAPDVEAGPLFVECKARRVSVATVYERTVQAAKARKGTVPVVVSKTTPSGPMLVSLDLRDFVRLLGTSPAIRRQWRAGWGATADTRLHNIPGQRRLGRRGGPRRSRPKATRPVQLGPAAETSAPTPGARR